MQSQQVTLRSIEYVSENATSLTDAAVNGEAISIPSAPPDVRFVRSWYCPPGEKGPATKQEGVELLPSGEVKKAFWRYQAPMSREGAEFSMRGVKVIVSRGRALDNRLTPVVVQESGKPPRLVLYAGAVPGESKRKQSKAEASSAEWKKWAWSCYIPRRENMQGWTTNDLKAQLCWWASKWGKADKKAEGFITRHANGVWPGEGPGQLFDGYFKAPLSPLAIKAYIRHKRLLSNARTTPSTDLVFPAKILDVSHHLGIPLRTMYYDASKGKIPCEVVEGPKGHEYFILEKHIPGVKNYYYERDRRRAILAGWKKARGCGDTGAREWMRSRLLRGQTLDELEDEVFKLLQG
jgi:hypothetical protein